MVIVGIEIIITVGMVIPGIARRKEISMVKLIRVCMDSAMYS